MGQDKEVNSRSSILSMKGEQQKLNLGQDFIDQVDKPNPKIHVKYKMTCLHGFQVVHFCKLNIYWNLNTQQDCSNEWNLNKYLHNYAIV